jgi:hypothetical protein
VANPTARSLDASLPRRTQARLGYALRLRIALVQKRNCRYHRTYTSLAAIVYHSRNSSIPRRQSCDSSSGNSFDHLRRRGKAHSLHFLGNTYDPALNHHKIFLALAAAVMEVDSSLCEDATPDVDHDVAAGSEDVEFSTHEGDQATYEGD